MVRERRKDKIVKEQCMLRCKGEISKIFACKRTKFRRLIKARKRLVSVYYNSKIKHLRP